MLTEERKAFLREICREKINEARELGLLELL